jgi:molybdate transport system regulatory protein
MKALLPVVSGLVIIVIWMPAMPAPLVPRDNLWLERDGQVVLSKWRVRLLQAIEETGSITAAAERMRVQYRCAWNKLEEMERGLGLRLVERRVGGPAGGGARLTEAGQDYVARFTRFAQAVDEVVTQHFEESFAKA